MDQNTMIVLIVALAAVVVIALVFGRRIRSATFKLLGFTSELKGGDSGPTIDRNEVIGDNTEMEATGSGQISRNTVEGQGNKFKAG